MLRKDSILLGMGIAVFFFITIFFTLYQLDGYLTGREVFGTKYYGVRDQFIGILAVISNIIPFIIYQKAHKDRSMRGVGIVTVILALGAVFYYNILG